MSLKDRSCKGMHRISLLRHCLRSKAVRPPEQRVETKKRNVQSKKRKVIRQ